MTPAEAFLADIIEHPDDDAPRLIYADWLEDHGDASRAEFIRVQCELARLPPHALLIVGKHHRKDSEIVLRVPSWLRVGDYIQDGSVTCIVRALVRHAAGSATSIEVREGESAESYCDGEVRERLERRAWELLYGGPCTCADQHRTRFDCYYEQFVGEHRAWQGIPEAVVFRRGFIESVTCDATDWLRHADALTAAAPIRKVTLTTWPERMQQNGLTCDTFPVYLAETWPGITFTIPAIPRFTQSIDPPALSRVLRTAGAQLMRATREPPAPWRPLAGREIPFTARFDS